MLQKLTVILGPTAGFVAPCVLKENNGPVLNATRTVTTSSTAKSLLDAATAQVITRVETVWTATSQDVQRAMDLIRLWTGDASLILGTLKERRPRQERRQSSLLRTLGY
jgi:hypothetical protein